MKRIIPIVAALCATWSLVPSIVRADPVKDATRWYLKGTALFNEKKYNEAIKALNKAYNLLPGHPHFNCHRASFLNYQGRAHEGSGSPRAAMSVYYRAAYRTGCKKPQQTSYAAARYRTLYHRWMCSINFETTPPKSRIVIITERGDQEIGFTPMKKEFAPGTYRFKYRLYDHRTYEFSVTLRPGMHVTRAFTMVKGDDPINRPEKVDVAPPPPVAGGNNPDPNNPDKTALAPPPERRNRISFGQEDNLGTTTGLTPPDARPEEDPLLASRKKGPPPGPPIYKQAWFWIAIGAVVVGTTVIIIVIPKEQQLRVSESTLF